MKRLFLILMVALLAACAGGVPSLNAQLKTAYDTTNAYVEVTKTSLMRGRISADQAARASANAKQARESIDTAAAALASCKLQTPCAGFQSIMQGLQPTLYEFERELRAQQGAKP